MIRIYADGELVNDSRIEEYDLIELSYTTALNRGGTAELVMPPTHPSYSRYVAYRTITEIQRDNEMIFRGRPLYIEDDIDNNRRVVFEGDLCFFGDAPLRPYLYQAAPADIFGDLVAVYNAQVESYKQFRVGSVTVTDANDYVRMESGEAVTVFDGLMKLVERCGGYYVFTTAEDGARVIHYLAEVGTRSEQEIVFGENLLDFVRTGENTDIATGILPYGAKDESTGQRLTIETVNGGVDHLIDEETAALRGTIIKTAVWDDVTVAENLLRKAEAWLLNNRSIVTALELTAIDLSRVNKNIDSYAVGDMIHVFSKPHGVDEDFQLIKRTENMIDPSESRIVLGKIMRSLTGDQVRQAQESQSELNRVAHEIEAGYKAGIQNAIKESERELSSLIDQTSRSILLEVSNTYATESELQESISTQLKVLENSVSLQFSQLRAEVDENGENTQEKFSELYQYIRFEGGNITLGKSDSKITLTIENDLIVFRRNGVQFGWWDGVDFHTGNIVVEVSQRAQFGNFAFVPRNDGSLSFVKVGE